MAWFHSDFFLKKYPHNKSMKVNGPQGVHNLDSRLMVGMIYEVDHQTLLYTKYTCCGPNGYR